MVIKYFKQALELYSLTGLEAAVLSEGVGMAGSYDGCRHLSTVLGFFLFGGLQ